MSNNAKSFHSCSPVLRKAIAASLLCAAMFLCSCSSAAPVDDTADRYAAYYAKCQEYSTIYGPPSIDAFGFDSEIGSGLCIARLIDMDGDGAEELLLGYSAPVNPALQNYQIGIELWTFQNGKAVLADEIPYSLHGSNGFQPFVEIHENPSGGAVVVTEKCYGSAPVSFAYDVFGYQEGKVVHLTGRADQRGWEGTFFYICPDGTGNYWLDGNWIPCSESEYNAAFDEYVGETVLHAHLFHYSSGDFDDDGGDTLAETLDKTRETLSLLAESGE